MTSAHDLLRSALVWDNHACPPLRPGDVEYLPVLDRYRAAGVDVVSLNVGFGEQGIEDHIRMLSHLRGWIAARSSHYRLATRADDIAHARAAGQLAICFDVEGMCALGGQADLVQLYYDLGVRWMLIAYNHRNEAGSGCQDDADEGLSDFGRSVIDEMNRAGMLPCCSHTGYQTAREVIDHSSSPVLFSHSNARALWDHPRNIPDDLMRRCADKGGVIGINGVGLFLGSKGETAPLIARHIDYAIKVAGEDHVALGIDYVFDQSELDDYVAEMSGTFPASYGYSAGMRLTAPEELPLIVEGLVALGHPHRRIEKVLGGNLLRLARDCWA
jgi:Zn-dependent dipeptidase, microsomal dipeptidase homolog